MPAEEKPLSDDLAAALTREHRDIDAGIEAYLASRAQGPGDPEPLQHAFAALRRHIYLEETVLFPPLREAGLTMPIMVMLREHGALWDAMSELERTVAGDDGADPAVLCQALLAALDAHNTKEEPIIYPHADLDLTPDTAAHLRALLDTGSLPDGWTCTAAD